MDDVAQVACEVPGHHGLDGEQIEPDDLAHPLARSIFRFTRDFGGRDLRVEGARRLSADLEAIALTVKTGSPQAPAFDILPEERLAVLFREGAAPHVVPLRKGFPATPHTFGLPVDTPVSAGIALCIDDRPWGDAGADYNGAEVLRRIFAWFRRAGTGEMDDEMQFRDPAFVPPPGTIVMSTELELELLDQDRPPLVLALTQSEEASNVWSAVRHDLAEPPSIEGQEWVRFICFPLGFEVENAGAMWRPPQHLGHLRRALANPNSDLLDRLRAKVSQFLDAAETPAEAHHAQLLIRILMKNLTTDRLEGFCLLSHSTIGELGAAMGLLWPTDSDAGGAFVKRIPTVEPDEALLEAVQLTAMGIVPAFDQETAQAWAGSDSPDGKAVAFGAGAIGCQVLNNLVREGGFSQVDIVDDDRLLPHNLVRHVLREGHVGEHKAKELAEELRLVRPDLKAAPHVEQLRGAGMSPDLVAAIEASDLAIDLTASVGASRLLSDLERRGRAVSAFYNPRGTAVVVMVEDEGRQEDLATLEARYYGEVVDRPELEEHLAAPDEAVVSSGQCRSVTSRISSSDAAMLAAAASRAIGIALREPSTHLSVSTLRSDGSLQVVTAASGGETLEAGSGGWRIRVPAAVRLQLEALRKAALPAETGGVLLGVVDHRRRRIEVSLGLPPPADSLGSPTAFERGVQDLPKAIEIARAKVMHQITYLGEWHTHPDGAWADPSPIDRRQLDELAADLCTEERPAVMLIVGESGMSLSAQGAET